MSIQLQSNYLASTYSTDYNRSASQGKSTVAKGDSSQQHTGVDYIKLNTVNLYGNESYSKEDAIFNAWSIQNTISLDDLRSGKKITFSSSISPDFLPSLEQGTLVPEYNFRFASSDIHSQSIDNLQQSVNYIASRYAVMKEYIGTNFSGEKQDSYFKKLEDIFYSAQKDLAQNLADQVGSFFGEYGFDNIKEEIYRSISAEADVKIAAYSSFIQSNKNYAGIDGTKEEWLKTDSAYMASELRKATKGVIPKTTASAAPYTLDELQQMNTFAKEMEHYTSGASQRISFTDSEERIAMQLAEVVLKGEMFNQYAGVSQKVQNMIHSSIDNYLAKTVEQIKKSMENQIAIKGSRISSSVRRGYAAIDEDSIFRVINMVRDTYERTGDFLRSFWEGAIYAYNQQDEKTQTGQVDGIYRYTYNGSRNLSWRNFFESTDPIVPSWCISPLDGYVKRESGMESIISSWNSFAAQITSNKAALLSISSFSAFA